MDITPAGGGDICKGGLPPRLKVSRPRRKGHALKYPPCLPRQVFGRTPACPAVQTDSTTDLSDRRLSTFAKKDDPAVARYKFMPQWLEATFFSRAIVLYCVSGCGVSALPS